ncbi:hypothetical protein [Leptospira weilii]|uniref:hypothetical protein n=1 Tax=Leptospira weilii TaxID=28184 RepID=UPI0021002858|nr:hypothetical protein [Leptospira weilii]
MKRITLLLGRVKMILENKRSVLQKYSGSQKLSQIGNPDFLEEDSNFRNKFVIVFYSCVRVVIRRRMLEARIPGIPVLANASKLSFFLSLRRFASREF